MSNERALWLAQRRSVEAFERAERSSMSVEDKVRALGRLMASVDAMGLREELRRDDDAIRARWNRLRERLGRP